MKNLKWQFIAFSLLGCTIGSAQEVRSPVEVASRQTASLPGQVPQDSAEELEAAKVIARVGDEVVLAGDLYGQINQFLHTRMQQIPAEQRSQLTPELLEQQRWKLMQQMLPQVIDAKLIYLDFLGTVPKDKLPELQDSLYRAFDEQQLPVLIERAKVETAADLDKQLRGFGSSLDQQRRTFAEQLAAVQWRNRHGTDNSEISHEDLLTYYRENRDSFRIEAKARWEQLSAFDSKTGSRQVSRQRIAGLGNEVFRGAAFAAVARRDSHGPTAKTGGNYDWTTQGSLRSDVLDQAIFSLPLGKLSRILEDDDGCHIVRVTERQQAGFVSFAEAQQSIKDKIKEQRREAASENYVSKLREKYPVWTVFDDQVASRN